MKKLLSLFFTFLMLPSAMQAMLKRPVGRPRAPQASRQVPKVLHRSIVDVRHLKNVHTVIKHEYAHLSPLVGASLINSDYLKKLYQFAPTHPTTRLLNDPKLGLFNLQNTQFRDTQSLSMPGKSLNPELIGEMLGHLDTGKLEVSQVQNDLIKQWKKTLHDDFKASISTEKLSQFLKLVQDSKKAESDPEQNRLYIPHITEGILTGFLYRKVNKKEDLLHYLNTLNKHVPLLKENPDEKLVSDNYTSQELKQKYKTLDDLYRDSYNQLQCIEKDFEGSVCALMHQNNSTELPPQVLQSSYGYQGQRAVPNCTETALHDLCNLLLGDSTTGLFNLKLLPSTVQPIKEFCNFYTNHCDYSTVNNPKVGQAWMDLVSNRNSIIYVQKNYEVECFADNILNLLNILFNIKAKSWEEFGQILSNEHRTVACKEKIEDKIHTISFSVNDNEFDLVIESGQHTYLNFPNRSSNILGSFCPDTRMLLFKNYKNMYATSLVPLLPPSLYDIKFENSLDQNIHALFANISEDPNKLAEILNKISHKAKDAPLLRETIKKLFTKLPQNDNHFKRLAVCIILASRANESFKDCADFVETYLNSAQDSELSILLDMCIENPDISIDQIKLLLNQKAKVGWVTLYYAIKNNCKIETMKELIKEEHWEIKSLRVNFPENLLWTAFLHERTDIIELFLTILLSPADNYLKRNLLHIPTVIDHMRNSYAHNPLDCALHRIYRDSNNTPEKHSLYLAIAKKFIALGALSCNKCNENDAWIKAIKELLISQENDKFQDAYELIKLFCDTSNVNITNHMGENTLSVVIDSLRESKSEEKKAYCYQIIDLLLKAGATPTYHDSNGKTISALKMAMKIKDKKLEDLIRSNIKATKNLSL